MTSEKAGCSEGEEIKNNMAPNVMQMYTNLWPHFEYCVCISVWPIFEKKPYRKRRKRHPE